MRHCSVAIGRDNDTTCNEWCQRVNRFQISLVSTILVLVVAVAAFLQDTGKEAERGTDTATIPE